MKKRQRNLLGFFILLSLAAHLGAWSLFAGRRGSEPPTEMSVTLLAPDEEESEKPDEEATAGHPEEETPAPTGTQRFRPTEVATDEQGPQAEKQPAAVTGTGAAAPEIRTADQLQQYRRELMANFDPDWQAVPDLLVRADAKTQHEVSRHFGMKLIAYPKDQDKPEYVVVIDEAGEDFQYTRDFDFAQYSNRVKDRASLPEYAQLARRIKSRLGLPEELAVVSLVPLSADAYFAAKQMQAVKAAGLAPSDIARTSGHYAAGPSDKWCLIIDTVVDMKGTTSKVQDPEATRQSN